MTDPNQAIEFIYKQAPKFAKAKSERVYLEEFRKTKKALLMGQSTAKTAAEREQQAYAHPEYLEVLEGLRAAIEVEEGLRWQLIAAQSKVEIWRTESANNRRMDRAAQ